MYYELYLKWICTGNKHCSMQIIQIYEGIHFCYSIDIFFYYTSELVSTGLFDVHTSWIPFEHFLNTIVATYLLCRFQFIWKRYMATGPQSMTHFHPISACFVAVNCVCVCLHCAQHSCIRNVKKKKKQSIFEVYAILCSPHQCVASIWTTDAWR